MTSADDKGHAQGETPLLLKKQGLGIVLDMSRRSIDRKDAAGLIPRPVNLAGSKRWRRDEIKAWIAAGCPPRKQREAMQPFRRRPVRNRMPNR
jgi:predicted DNA-binding transcriptional regulator AlpA